MYEAEAARMLRLATGGGLPSIEDIMGMIDPGWRDKLVQYREQAARARSSGDWKMAGFYDDTARQYYEDLKQQARQRRMQMEQAMRAPGGPGMAQSATAPEYDPTARAAREAAICAARGGWMENGHCQMLHYRTGYGAPDPRIYEPWRSGGGGGGGYAGGSSGGWYNSGEGGS